MLKKLLIVLITALALQFSYAQSAIDEDQLGAWYMYFFQKKFSETSKFGIQGDYQFRYWNVAGDMEQRLLRTGLTYRPSSNDILFTAGFAHIATGAFGDSDETTNESRTYLEALFGQKIGSRFLLTHRFRFEQRWVDNQDFRTRYRYNIFLNVPLNATELKKNTVYLALYNEIFINGETEIGDGRTVNFFDRNRTYLGFGYNIKDNLRAQAGWMQQTTEACAKGQLQFSLHHNW